MDRRDLLRFHYESLEYRKEEQPMMTPEERAKIAMELAHVILKFLNLPQITTNQEAFEILGIASMCYHSLVFKAFLSAKEEKT